MRKSAAIAIACLAFAVPAFADDAPVSEASARALLEITHARKLLEGVFGQMDATMKSAMQQALAGHTLNSGQQKRLDQLNADVVVVFREEMNWEKLEPMYLKIYRDSFTQSEVDGMLAFYATPAGKAVIEKMPLVVQNTMQGMQQFMFPMIKRVQQMSQTAAQEVLALETKPEPSKTDASKN